jgi:hypothetical protein
VIHPNLAIDKDMKVRNFQNLLGTKLCNFCKNSKSGDLVPFTFTRILCVLKSPVSGPKKWNFLPLQRRHCYEHHFLSGEFFWQLG